MDYKAIISEDLRTYRLQECACNNMREKLRVLDEEISRMEELGTPPSLKRRDDRLHGLILERGKVRIRLALVEEDLRFLRTGLDALSHKERETLRLFFIDRPEGYVDAVCMLYETPTRSGAYYHKDQAIRALVRACYGEV